MIKNGGSAEVWTRDTLIKSQVLYRLSYGTKMVDLGGLEPPSKNQLLIRNLILTLQVLCISFYLYSLLHTNLKRKSLYIVNHNSKSIRINFTMRQSLQVNTTTLFLIAYWYLCRSCYTLRKGNCIYSK